MIIIRLRAGFEKRFKTGHPWVYSNELFEIPKGLVPGDLVELRDAGGKFLGRGYANPHSLISFRCLSRDASVENPLSEEFISECLLSSWRLRNQMGFDSFSYRLSYGEADSLPGLVIDRYRLADEGQVLVVQAHTAGMDRICGQIIGILKSWNEKISKETRDPVSWNQTVVVLRNDLGVRKMEGLKEENPLVLYNPSNRDLKSILFKIRPIQPLFPNSSEAMVFESNLFDGQKTGFFLDQFSNIQLAYQRFEQLGVVLAGKSQERLKILDLCCYVGQWGTQLSSQWVKKGIQVEVSGVDASSSALEFAKKNTERVGAMFKPFKMDVLRGLELLPSESFDIIISDPPALIKSRKDVGAGTHAYLQLNTQVFRLLKKGGAVICCSCSALLDETSFEKTLGKAAQRNQALIQWVGRGSQSPDHPMLIEFPEGRYLKSWMGIKV